MRLDGFETWGNADTWIAIGLMLPVTIFVFIRTGFYRAVIRYISTRALRTIFWGIAASAAFLFVVSQALGLFVTRPVPGIYAMLAFLSAGDARFFLRELVFGQRCKDRTTLLIYGAGTSGRDRVNGHFRSNLRGRPMLTKRARGESGPPKTTSGFALLAQRQMRGASTWNLPKSVSSTRGRQSCMSRTSSQPGQILLASAIARSGRAGSHSAIAPGSSSHLRATARTPQAACVETGGTTAGMMPLCGSVFKGRLDNNPHIHGSSSLNETQKYKDTPKFCPLPNTPDISDTAVVKAYRIAKSDAGPVALVAPNVANHGVITARMGRVELASGDRFTVDLYGDGLFELAVGDEVASQVISNTGRLSAEGGTIAITAAAGRNIVRSLVTIEGELRAPSIEKKGGKIIISAAGSKRYPEMSRQTGLTRILPRTAAFRSLKASDL